MTLPSDIRIHRPDTVAEALSVLQRFEDAAAPYAGGTELVPVLKLGLSSVRHLVDVRRIPELSTAPAAPGSLLRLGAAMTHRMVLRSPEVLSQWPELARMERTIGNVRVQGSGTIGGNLCFADPQSDPATFLTAAGARLACLSAARPPRYACVEEFILGPYSNSLAAGNELLGWIELPRRKPSTAMAHRKVAFSERPEATCAVLLESEGGLITAARIAIGSVTPAPVLSACSAELLGMRPAEVVCAAEPVADAIVGALTDRLLHESRTPFMRAVTRRLVADVTADAAASLAASAQEGGAGE